MGRDRLTGGSNFGVTGRIQFAEIGPKALSGNRIPAEYPQRPGVPARHDRPVWVARSLRFAAILLDESARSVAILAADQREPCGFPKRNPVPCLFLIDGALVGRPTSTDRSRSRRPGVIAVIGPFTKTASKLRLDKATHPGIVLSSSAWVLIFVRDPATDNFNVSLYALYYLGRVSATHCVARLRGHVVSRAGKMFDVKRALSPFPHGAIVA